MSQKQSNYNDGYIGLYSVIKNEASFGAKLNITSKSQLIFIIKLAYEEMSKREQDITFAESTGKSLSIKVKTRLREIDKKSKVLIGNQMYNIIDVDYDRKNQEMYLYMEEERLLDA